MDTALTPELRDILDNLVTGLFGLDAWVREVNKYKPPHEALPWRAPGHVFKPSDLGVIPFFENLLRETSGDDDLGVRWAAVTADPLRSSPLPDAKAWRKNRGLTADPKFGIVKSSNVWLTNAGGRVISRATFYAGCWQPLLAAVHARNPANDADWALLASDLFNNNVPQWPGTQQPTSTAFIVQFTSDMLYALLGQRNQPEIEGWQRAVLVELGEYRRPGNRYTRDETDAAVDTFETLVGIQAPDGNGPEKKETKSVPTRKAASHGKR
jgi:hypothetical protein